MATVFSSSNCFKNLKYSTNGCAFALILPTKYVSSSFASSASNLTPFPVSSCSTPSNPHIKSRCQKVLLNSPSVIAWKPSSFCFATNLVISSFTILSYSSFCISPFFNFSFESFNICGLKKLPTKSYLNGVFNVLIINCPFFL